MASFVTPKRATEFIFYVSLVSQANTKTFQAASSLSAGDVKISKDGGAEANLNTLPVVTPAGSKRIKVTVSATEMDAENVQITFSDVAGAEWCDLTVNIQTTARQIDDLAFPTVSGRSTDTTATGAVGIDWANVESQSTSVNLSATTINLVNTITTYTGNTPQTGDAYAIVNSGTFGNAAIKGYVDDIGVAGAGLTAIPDSAGTTTLLTRLGTPSDLGGGATVAANLSDIESQTDDIGVAGAGLTAIPSSGGTDWTATEREQIRYRLGIDGTESAPVTNLDTKFGNMECEYFTIINQLTANELNFDNLNGNTWTINNLIVANNDIQWNNDWNAEVLMQVEAAWYSTINEDYRATSAAGSPAQLLYEILQNIIEFSIIGTQKIVRKLDGTTTAKEYELDSDTIPTSITETL